MSDILAPGKKKAEQAAAAQAKQIKEQKVKEQAKLAETESDIARRKAMATGGGGRQSLIATGATGVAKTLGGGA